MARLILRFLIMSLCSYEKAGRLAKFSVAQREISVRAGDGLLINPTQFLWRKKDVSRASPAYGGGCHKFDKFSDGQLLWLRDMTS